MNKKDGKKNEQLLNYLNSKRNFVEEQTVVREEVSVVKQIRANV